MALNCALNITAINKKGSNGLLTLAVTVQLLATQLLVGKEVHRSPDVTPSFIPRIRIYRGSLLFPVSLNEILRKM
jgi:hypothetical protein